MDFQDYLLVSAHETEKVISQTLKRWRKEVSLLSPKLLPLVDLFLEACQGGKRLRATLVRLGYEITRPSASARQASPSDRNDWKRILKPAAALELFQTGILAQDDIVDLSPLRRGRPTVYHALGADHYSFSQTMILGDIGMFLAAKLILDSNFLDISKNQAVSLFCQMVIDTGLGEMLDVELPHLKQKSAKDIETIFRLKTAHYTFIDPLSIGAILGGTKPDLLRWFRLFGENLGLAYQIQDDILGVFGDEKTLGKSVTSDIEEGKNTLLITYALEHADSKQKKVLDKYYGTGKIGEVGLERVRKVFKDSGSLQYSQAQALKYVNQAKKVITQITKDPKYITLLEGLSDFLINRQR